MTAAALLRAAGLRKAYAGPPPFALDVPALEIAQGCATLLSGPNGAGKSTLLRMLAGLEQAGEHAQLAWRGQPVARLALGRDAAYLHQDPRIFRTTALGNVAYAAARCGRSEQDAHASLQWAGLAEHAHANARRLSGGQQRRLALARIHVMPAPLLLLDEPTAHLDAQGAASVARLIGELAGSGRAVLAATHDSRLTEALPDARSLAIAGGRLAA